MNLYYMFDILNDNQYPLFLLFHLDKQESSLFDLSLKRVLKDYKQYFQEEYNIDNLENFRI